jgi:phosphoribosylformimino-5-aminoimidazole carboxamide ribotide isomerase
MMQILPAVDIKNGKCVRLYQGDYNRETVFSDDPVAVAMQWKAMGASRLHVVDLDGAAAGGPRNMHIAGKIAKETGLPVQFGGGIRTEATIEQALSAGIARIIMGTIAVEDPDLLKKLCEKYGEAIIVSVDARNGYIATRGWLTSTESRALDFSKRLMSMGVKRMLYTDIQRDGTLTEPDFETIGELARNVQLPVIAAGGVATVEHLRTLKKLGAEGAIIGKALYTGNVDLKEALAIEQEEEGA